MNIQRSLKTVTQKATALHLVQELSAMPLKKFDIHFMGNDNISLEMAQTIIPGLPKISCHTRTNAQFNSDVAAWVNKQLVV